jgi:AraC-like DNA-binding protein
MYHFRYAGRGSQPAQTTRRAEIIRKTDIAAGFAGRLKWSILMVTPQPSAFSFQPSSSAIPGLSPGSELLAELKPYVRQCGCQRRSAWHLAARRILDFLLVYIEEGHGRFTVDGVTYDAAPGDLFWIPPGVVHEMRGFPPSMLCPYAHFDLVYRPAMSHWEFSVPGGMTDLGELEALMHPPPPPPLDQLNGRLRIPTAHRIGERLHRICEQATRATGYAQVWMSASMLEVIALVLEGNALADDDSAVRHRVAIERTASYMRNHCAEPLYVDDLARRTGISSCYFRRLFAGNFGMSPHAYLVQARLSRAKDLMLHTAMTLSEIASLTGFSSVHNFSRTFRQYEKMSPSTFRCAGRQVPVQVEGRTPSYSH